MLRVKVRSDNFVHPLTERVDIGVGQVGSGDRFMDDNIGVAFVEQLGPGWPDVPGAINRDRNHRKASGNGHPKRTFLKWVQIAVAAPGSFGKHDQRIAVLLCPGYAFVDRGIGPSTGATVDLDDSGDMQGLCKHRDLVQLLLGEIPDRRWYRSKQQRDIEVREMVGEEEVLRVGFNVVDTADVVAHRWHEEERPAPQLDHELPGLTQTQGHDDDEHAGNDDRVQDE